MQKVIIDGIYSNPSTESLVFTRARILFLVSLLGRSLSLVSLLFVPLLDPFDPYSPFKFLIYY